MQGVVTCHSGHPSWLWSSETLSSINRLQRSWWLRALIQALPHQTTRWTLSDMLKGSSLIRAPKMHTKIPTLSVIWRRTKSIWIQLRLASTPTQWASSPRNPWLEMHRIRACSQVLPKMLHPWKNRQGQPWETTPTKVRKRKTPLPESITRSACRRTYSNSRRKRESGRNGAPPITQLRRSSDLLQLPKEMQMYLRIIDHRWVSPSLSQTLGRERVPRICARPITTATSTCVSSPPQSSASRRWTTWGWQ